MSDLAFQLISLSLEDRMPGGLAEGVDAHELLSDDFFEHASPVRVDKEIADASVGFLFGRMENGESLCVRVPGIRPKLFFDADVPQLELKLELQTEVRAELKGTYDSEPLGLRVTPVQFARFNGYEPDATTASGRKLHNYLQVEYPSVRAWRKAVALRKEDDERTRQAKRSGSTPPPRRWRLAHECNVDPITRVLRESKLIPGGWNTVRCAAPVDVRVTTCNVEVEASACNLAPAPERLEMAPYVSMYYDIETHGLDPASAGIIQVSLVFVRGDLVEKHCVCLGGVSPLPGAILHCVASEGTLLRKFRQLVVEKDPDFVVAYNGVNFDNRFLQTRATEGHAETEQVEAFFYMSRFAHRPSRLRELCLSSSGMGDNHFYYMDMIGRATIDFFVKFKVDEPSEVSGALSHFVRKYIPDEDKEDMDYAEIPVLQAGSDDDRRRLASYCIHDSYLLHLLNKTRNILVIILQFSQVFGILPEWVYFRGQQVRFISQLLQAVRTLEEVPLLIQTPADGFVGMFDDEGYEGATVNEPITGFYADHPIVTLDWKSLYPSIMLAHNLCHSTHVRSAALQRRDGVVSHAIRPLGMTWNVVEQGGTPHGGDVCTDVAVREIVCRRWRESLMKDKAPLSSTGAASQDQRQFRLTKEDHRAIGSRLFAGMLVRLGGDDVDEADAGRRRRRYAQPAGAHTTYFTTAHRGILPRIVETLLAERVECKRLMKVNARKEKALRETDPAMAAHHSALADVFDGRQLAIKVSANSVYGACGAGATGKCPNKDVSETVTFEGRETMTILKDIIAASYPEAQIVYGDTDSVMIKFETVRDVVASAPLGHEVADFITAEFARLGYPQMIMEFEKSYLPYLLLKKKRYIGLKFEPDGDDMVCKGIEAKGVETERKDTLPFLKCIYNDVRDELMYRRDASAAVQKLEAHLWRLVRDDVPFEQFVMSKGLKSGYKNPASLVQWCVNEKKRARQAGSEAAVGNRVQYVIVNGPKDAKNTELAEDPEYVKRNGLKLNRQWYFEHSIQNPMESLFAHIPQVDTAKLFEVIRAELKRERMGGGTLRGMVVEASASKEPTRRLFEPKPPPPGKRKKK